jgi:uncharacterized damage-inducible protein DinB
MTDPRFPIGRFEMPAVVSAEDRPALILRIETTPARLRDAISKLNDAQLDTPYREGGWTIREVIHHLPDSHMNSYVRFKLALTENEPLIKTYDEAAWGQLGDVKSTPVEVSLQLLEALHTRWVSLLRSMTEADWGRTLVHPEKMDVNNGRIRLDQLLAMYAWHGDHHLAHVHQALSRR